MSELISSWLNEDMESLNDSCSDDSENDDNTVSVERHIEENYESDESTENTGDESEPDDEGENEYYLGKDKITKWKKNPPPRNTRTAHCNIITHLPGVKPHARNAKTIIESWSLFFPDNVIQEIVTCTNIYLTKIRINYGRERDVLDTSVEEMRALFGLLYIAGMMKSNHLNLSDLWSNDGFSPEYFRAVMSKTRFYLLLRALRFDDINTRSERKKFDKLAPIRTIFDGFVDRCKLNYTIGEYCTIDEMLEGFRGKCNFRQYIPNKPNKYGIKIFSLVDARLFYTANMEVYVGKQPNGPYNQDNSASSIVKRMISPITKTGRNITIDNWFTSVPLAVDLLQNHKITVVGTIRKNKREIPPLFLDTKKREVNSSKFGYSKECLLVSYVPNKNKNVLMLSTMHKQGDIDVESGEQRKPEVITFYNFTKGGVDVVDELKAEYSVARISCRWPLTIFFTLINIAGINSQIIYKANTDTTISRRQFLKYLGQDLCKPFMVQRLNCKNLSFDLRKQINRFTGQISTPTQEDPKPTERVKCAYCPARKNRYTVVSRYTTKLK